MGAKDYQWNATPSGPRHERRADLPFGAYDLIDWLSGESHETRRTRSQDDTDRRRRYQTRSRRCGRPLARVKP